MLLCASIACIDWATSRSGWNDMSRWCGIHSFVNGWITVQTWPSVLFLLESPFVAIRQQYYVTTPMYAVLLLHAYHIVRYRCTMADYVHHGIFVAVAGALTQWVPIGPTGEWLIFFGCGLPGCIDYGMWCGVHRGWCSRLTRLREALVLNLFLRGPGMCVGGLWFWLYLCANWGPGSLSWPQIGLFAVSLLVSAGNGQYYTAAVSIKCGANGIKLF